RVLEEVTRGRLAENLRRGAEETPRGHVEVHAQRAELALEQRGDEELRRAPGPEDFVLGASFADCRDSAAAARAERDDRSRRLRTRERELEPPLQSAGRISVIRIHRSAAAPRSSSRARTRAHARRRPRAGSASLSG